MKYTLITGATSGIGKELAYICAQNNHNLILVSRNKNIMQDIKQEIENKYNTHVEIFPLDLIRKDSVEELVIWTKKYQYEVDILINNAGFGDYGEFITTNLKKQEEMLQLNINALTQLTYYFAQAMVSNNFGRIMNVASIAAFQSGPLMSVYYATKAYVLSFSEALYVELKGKGVRVTCLCPGPTRTGFEDSSNLEDSGLFKNLKVDSAAYVAQFGYKMMMKGRPIAIPGIRNKIMVSLSKLSPRFITRRFIYRIQK